MMAIYSSVTELYTCAGQLFERIQVEDPKAVRPLLGSRLVIRFQIIDLDGVIVINGRSRPLKTEFGANGTARPDLDIELTSDALHQILLGELMLPKAIGSKQIKAKGAVFKVAGLVNLFLKGQKIYPEILREQGLLSK